MTVVRYSRQQIIDVINAETNYIAEWWINTKEGDYVRWAPVSDCIGCAVGTLIRNAVHPSTWSSVAVALCMYNVDNMACSMVSETAEEAEAKALFALENSNSPLTALSIIFESAMNRGSISEGEAVIGEAVIERTKVEVVAFIVNHFPPFITFDIKASIPAEGVEVVSP